MPIKEYTPYIGASSPLPENGYTPHLLTLPRGSMRLEQLGTPIHFPKNHVIINGGEIPTHCYVLKKGKVFTFEYSASGEERIYHFMEKGSLFLEGNLLFHQPVPVTFKTNCETDVIAIDRAVLLSAICHNPQIALDVIQSNSNKFFSSMEQIRQTRNHNTSWKICNLFLVFASHYGVPYDGKTLISEKISQQLISSMLGINRITTVRAVKELKDMGLIEQINGYYCIRDLEKLKRHQTMLDK